MALLSLWLSVGLQIEGTGTQPMRGEPHAELQAGGWGPVPSEGRLEQTERHRRVARGPEPRIHERHP